jgi:Flp pilus assembly pilin Flp
MLKLYIATQQTLHSLGERVTDRLHRDERGQTAAEYLGIIVVIALIIGALAAGGKDGGIARQIKNGVEHAIGNIIGAK